MASGCVELLHPFGHGKRIGSLKDAGGLRADREDAVVEPLLRSVSGFDGCDEIGRLPLLFCLYGRKRDFSLLDVGVESSEGFFSLFDCRFSRLVAVRLAGPIRDLRDIQC